MKMSKAERKAFNQGKALGYAEGYAEGYVKGYKEGNPFNAVFEAITNISKMMEDPEIQKALLKAGEEQEAEEEDAGDNNNSDNLCNLGDDLMDQ